MTEAQTWCTCPAQARAILEELESRIVTGAYREPFGTEAPATANSEVEPPD